MSTELDIDDVCAGHPQAQAELAAMRAYVETLRDSNAAKADRLDSLGEQVVRLRKENEALRAERDEDRRRNYGYSQQTVDAITQEREALRAEVEALRAERDRLTTLRPCTQQLGHAAIPLQALYWERWGDRLVAVPERTERAIGWTPIPTPKEAKR